MRFDEESHAKMVVTLEKRGMTIAQIMDRFDVSRRTAFRWLEYAELDGHDIVKRGSGAETTYHIENGE